MTSGTGGEGDPDSGATNSLDLLLAEDDDLNQKYFETLLLSAGHGVTIVSNGKDAVEAVRERAFDAVLMDIHMPVMNGNAATRAIRELSGDRAKIPVIALSGGVTGEGDEEYEAAGFTSYLAKPVENADLARVLSEVTGRSVYIPDYSINSSDVAPPSESAGKAVEAFLDDTKSPKTGPR
ncbi:MAG: response regulator [Alphaproteobacteria bacterium]